MNERVFLLCKCVKNKTFNNPTESNVDNLFQYPFCNINHVFMYTSILKLFYTISFSHTD